MSFFSHESQMAEHEHKHNANEKGENLNDKRSLQRVTISLPVIFPVLALKLQLWYPRTPLVPSKLFLYALTVFDVQFEAKIRCEPYKPHMNI